MRRKKAVLTKTIITTLIASFTTISASNICSAGVPREIGGFIVGENIEKYKDRLKMETAIPIRSREYLREVPIKDLEGFKSGDIWYGTVTSPGRIVRVRLKYEDSSKMFFDILLKEFKKRFGKPAEWRGDCFGAFIAWKWSITDVEGNKVSMILQHNIKDPKQKMGNVIKLTMWDLIDEEQRGFEQKNPDRSKSTTKLKIEPQKYKLEDLDRFIPR
jgi:hypothetical protein